MHSRINKNMTDRELEVLDYVVHGLTNIEIADRLMITQHTVKAHIASILRKMGVRNRLSAAILAAERGIVNLHQD